MSILVDWDLGAVWSSLMKVDYATPSSVPDVSEARLCAARWLRVASPALHAIFGLMVVAVVKYVLPKNAVIYGRVRYSAQYDLLVMGILITVVCFAFFSAMISALLARRNAGRWPIVLLFFELLIVVVPLAPVRSRSRELSNREKCIAQLRQIAQAVEHYAARHGGQLPGEFADLLRERDLTVNTLICPSSNDEVATGETMELLLSDFAGLHKCSYVWEGKGRTWPVNAAIVLAHDRIEPHQGGIHVLMGDGSVRWVQKSQADEMLLELESGHNPPRKWGRY